MPVNLPIHFELVICIIKTAAMPSLAVGLDHPDLGYYPAGEDISGLTALFQPTPYQYSTENKEQHAQKPN